MTLDRVPDTVPATAPTRPPLPDDELDGALDAVLDDVLDEVFGVLFDVEELVVGADCVDDDDADDGVEDEPVDGADAELDDAVPVVVFVVPDVEADVPLIVLRWVCDMAPIPAVEPDDAFRTTLPAFVALAVVPALTGAEPRGSACVGVELGWPPVSASTTSPPD